MNIEEVIDRFEARQILYSGLEDFDFGSLDKLNINRQKKYPIVIITVPPSDSKPFHKGANEPIFEEYNMTFHIFKKWDNSIKQTVPLAQIYREIETLGDGYLRDVLQQGSNDYFLVGDKTVKKGRGRFHEVTVDPVIGVSWSFTLGVFDCL